MLVFGVTLCSEVSVMNDHVVGHDHGKLWSENGGPRFDQINLISNGLWAFNDTILDRFDHLAHLERSLSLFFISIVLNSIFKEILSLYCGSVALCELNLVVISSQTVDEACSICGHCFNIHSVGLSNSC